MKAVVEMSPTFFPPQQSIVAGRGRADLWPPPLLSPLAAWSPRMKLVWTETELSQRDFPDGITQWASTGGHMVIFLREPSRDMKFSSQKQDF